jgi:hypothetical protein
VIDRRRVEGRCGEDGVKGVRQTRRRAEESREAELHAEPRLIGTPDTNAAPSATIAAVAREVFIG